MIEASFWRRLPAAELRGLTNGRVPAAAAASLSRSKLATGMYTSPRTSSTSGGAVGRRQRAAARHGDRRHVGGDVLADPAVAAGRRLHVAAALVADAHRQPVDLQLADVRAPSRPAGPGRPGRPTPRAPRESSRCRGSSSARRGSPGRTACSPSRRRRPPAGCRTRRRDTPAASGAQLADEGVEVAVGDLRVVELVVAAVVVADQFGQRHQSCFRLLDPVPLRRRSSSTILAGRQRRCAGRSRARRGTPARRRPGCAGRGRSAAVTRLRLAQQRRRRHLAGRARPTAPPARATGGRARRTSGRRWRRRPRQRVRRLRGSGRGTRRPR